MAGNSMGGWMALELARRGRAKSVCGLAPAGFWDEGWEDEHQRVAKLLLDSGPRRQPWPQDRAPALAFEPLPSLGAAATPASTAIGSRARSSSTPARTRCPARSPRSIIAAGFSLPAHEASCPVTIAWSAEDRLFPLAVYEERARRLDRRRRVPRPRRRRPRADVRRPAARRRHDPGDGGAGGAAA